MIQKRAIDGYQRRNNDSSFFETNLATVQTKVGINFSVSLSKTLLRRSRRVSSHECIAQGCPLLLVASCLVPRRVQFFLLRRSLRLFVHPADHCEKHGIHRCSSSSSIGASILYRLFRNCGLWSIDRQIPTTSFGGHDPLLCRIRRDGDLPYYRRA